MPFKRKPSDKTASRVIAVLDAKFRKATGFTKKQVSAMLLLVGVGLVVGLSLLGGKS